jgi:hypothetical protein
MPTTVPWCSAESAANGDASAISIAKRIRIIVITDPRIYPS